MVFAAVNTPASVCTVINIALRAGAFEVAQPDLSSTNTVDVVRLRSHVPERISDYSH